MDYKSGILNFEHNVEHNSIIICGLAVDHSFLPLEAHDRCESIVTLHVSQRRSGHDHHIALTMSAEQARELAEALIVQAHEATLERNKIVDRNTKRIIDGLVDHA